MRTLLWSHWIADYPVVLLPIYIVPVPTSLNHCRFRNVVTKPFDKDSYPSTLFPLTQRYFRVPASKFQLWKYGVALATIDEIRSDHSINHSQGHWSDRRHPRPAARYGPRQILWYINPDNCDGLFTFLWYLDRSPRRDETAGNQLDTTPSLAVSWPLMATDRQMFMSYLKHFETIIPHKRSSGHCPIYE